MTTRTVLTIEEFLAADWPPDTQLVDGQVVMDGPTLRHQETARRMVEALQSWNRAGARGGHAGFGGNWTVGAGQVLKPDAWWFHDRAQLDMDGPRNDGPPTLAVEVRSPGTWHLDTGRKREIYEQAGVSELWLVDTSEGTVRVHRRSGGSSTFDETLEFRSGSALTSPLLPGFSLDIDSLFAD